MSAIRILVVEDNSIVAEDIVLSLKDLGYEVVEHVKTGEAAIQAAQSHRPDLIMMDINLKGQLDGIQAVEKINAESPTPVIYLTAYSDSKTFERAKVTGPAAYLVKPFVEKDLRISIELAIHNFAVASRVGSTSPSAEHVIKDAIFLKINKKFIKITVSETTLIEADGSYCTVHTDHHKHLLTMNLRSFETHIRHPDLMRVSRSCIVNIRRVDSFEKDCLQIGNKQVSISKTYQEGFMKRFLTT